MERELATDTTMLVLVRHGTTAANTKQPYVLQGSRTDLGLNENGHRQAAAVGKFLRPFPIGHVWASPLQRARETAEHVARPHECTVGTVDGLSEIDVGDWEGLDWATVAQRWPKPYQAFQDDPGEAPYLGGESYSDVQQRAVPAIHELIENSRGHWIAVVAHNVVNRALLASFLGLPIRRARFLHQSNACVNIIRFREQAEVLTMNADFHLIDWLPDGSRA